MTTPTVQFAISLPRGPVSGKDRVILNLELENRGTAAAYVNARFAVVPEIGDVRLVIRAADGKEVPFKFRVRLVPLRASDFLLLEPGQRVVAGFHLSRGYDLSKPGAYEVMAQYVSQAVPPELEKANVFRGELAAKDEKLVVA